MITWKKASSHGFSLFDGEDLAIVSKRGSEWILSFEETVVPLKTASRKEAERVFWDLKTQRDVEEVASRFVGKTAGRSKVAGEVVFRKDNSNDANAWGYANNLGPEKRKIISDFNYSPKNAKPLAMVMRSVAAAMGHTISAHNRFTRIKSAKISPDGALGGKGFIMKIADIRKQLSNCIEALSAISDTLYDEVNAPHWSAISRQEGDEEKVQTQELIEDAEKIRSDPEQWADEEMEEEFGES